MFQRLLINQFVDGLPTPEMRLHVRSAGPATLQAAVQRCLEMSAIFTAEARRLHPAGAAQTDVTVPLAAATAPIFAMHQQPRVQPMTHRAQGQGNNEITALTKMMENVLLKLDELSSNQSQHSLSNSSFSQGSAPSHGFARRQPQQQQQFEPQVRRCFHCQETGHLQRSCPRRFQQGN